MDSIHDTIPSLIRNVKDQLARNYKLDYPFKRFSLIEVPIQFVGYERAWSQAQETVQPEMVLFPEKGALFDDMDMKKQVQNHIRWSRYGDRNEISLQEAQMRTFNNFIWRFAQTEGNFHPVAGEKVIFRQRQILIFFFHKSIISGIIFFLRNGLLPTG